MPVITTSKRKTSKSKSNLLPIPFVVLAVVCGIFFLARRVKSTTQADVVEPVEKLAKPAVTTENPQAGKPLPIADSIGIPNNEMTISGKVQVAQDAIAAPTNDPSRIIAPQKRPSGFSGGSAEQIIGMLLKSAEDGTGLPPMPALGSEESMMRDFLFAVTNDIEIYDGDDENTVAFKERVAVAKSQLAEYLGKGGSMTNAIAEYVGFINENKAIRDSVIAEYKRLRDEVSQEEANAYLIQANKELEAEGIATVNLGSERRRNAAKRAQRLERGN